MSIIVKSGVQGKVPAANQLEYGQLALNYVDQKIYFKNSNNQLANILVYDPTNYSINLRANNYSTWGSSFVAIQMGTGSIFSNTSSNLGFTYNAYNNGTNWTYKETNPAIRMRLDTSGINVDYAGSGTAGSTITFINLANITTNGTVLLGGATSNSSSQVPVTLTNGISTYEKSGQIKTVELSDLRASSAATMVIDISGGTDATSFIVDINFTAYQGKYGKYTHTVYKTNTWTDYGPSVVQSILSSGITITYSGSAGGAGVLRYTVSGMVSAQVLLTSVKVIAANSAIPGNISISFTYS